MVACGGRTGFETSEIVSAPDADTLGAEPGIDAASTDGGPSDAATETSTDAGDAGVASDADGVAVADPCTAIYGGFCTNGAAGYECAGIVWAGLCGGDGSPTSAFCCTLH